MDAKNSDLFKSEKQPGRLRPVSLFALMFRTAAGAYLIGCGFAVVQMTCFSDASPNLEAASAQLGLVVLILSLVLAAITASGFVPFRANVWAIFLAVYATCWLLGLPPSAGHTVSNATGPYVAWVPVIPPILMTYLYWHQSFLPTSSLKPRKRAMQVQTDDYTARRPRQESAHTSWDAWLP